MFSDTFSEKYFLCDERHGAGVGASVSGLRSKFLPLWKSNKKVLQCQRISRAIARNSGDARRHGSDNLQFGGFARQGNGRAQKRIVNVR
jgi:hypothetical protein